MNDLNQALDAALAALAPDAAPTRCACARQGVSLAMVYSPVQEFEALYSPEEGLCRGTVFMQLEKPFWGAGRVK